VNECGCDMEDDKRPNPGEEQDEREAKKDKSHKRLPSAMVSLEPVFQAFPLSSLSWLYLAGYPPATLRHGTSKKNREPTMEKLCRFYIGSEKARSLAHA
jgi:hypothetical protein